MVLFQEVQFDWTTIGQRLHRVLLQRGCQRKMRQVTDLNEARGFFPSDTVARDIMGACAVFTVPFDEGGYAWLHLLVDGAAPADVIVVVNGDGGSWPLGYIFADARYKVQGGHHEMCEVMYTNDDMADSVDQVHKFALAHRQRGFSVMATELGLPDAALRGVLRACVDVRRSTSIIRATADSLCESRGWWPCPRSLVRVLAGRVASPASMQAGAAPRAPRHVLDHFGCTDALCVVDAAALMSAFPCVVARRQAVLHRGWAWFRPGPLLDNVNAAVRIYLQGLASAPQLRRYVDVALAADPDDWTPEDRLVNAFHKAATARRRHARDSVNASPGAHNRMPACIQSLLETRAPWKNGTRYQLAYAVNELSSALGLSSQDVASVFIDFMRNKDMGEKRVSHFVSHLQRQGMTEDRRRCATRRHPSVAVAGDIACPFGGGVSGVRGCLARQGVSALDPSEATIGRIWAMSSDTPH